MKFLPTILLACTLVLVAHAAQKPVETTHANGAVHERYAIDSLGRKSGLYEQFREDGTLALRYKFEADLLEGRAEEFFADGRTLSSAGDYQAGLRRGSWLFQTEDQKRKQRAEYKAGELHGLIVIEIDGKLVSKQRWKDGELEKLDDMVAFPVSRQALREKLEAIQASPPATKDADPKAGERAAALRRLQAYRALCGVPWEGMTLVPEWNLRCEAAAEVCALIGELDHTPAKPASMDEARYRLAYEGTTHSNLHVGGDMPGSLDGYMDDSDPTNIDRIGHRRWCLNPTMRRTGFGSSGRFTAMWSMDESGKGPSGLDAVMYPPQGWCPADMFAPRAAFSIARLRGGEPKLEHVKVHMRRLDSEWVPIEDLALDHLAVISGGQGSGACIVFRPASIEVGPDSRFLIEVSTDAGKTQAYRYVVAFCEALTPVRGH